MTARTPPENTGRVVALALAFFGAFALLGYAEGVFDGLSTEVVVALAVFAALYALATVLLDPALGAWVRGRLPRRARKAPATSPARTRPAT